MLQKPKNHFLCGAWKTKKGGFFHFTHTPRRAKARACGRNAGNRLFIGGVGFRQKGEGCVAFLKTVKTVCLNRPPQRGAFLGGTRYAKLHDSWPQSAMTMRLDVAPDPEPYDSIFLTTSMPAVTEPKTTCLPSSQPVVAVHRKNLVWVLGLGNE